MEQPSVRKVSERIDTLLDELATSAPPAVLARAEELLRCVMGLYGHGLERVLDSVDADTARRLADDELVGSLLVLHDLHPDGLADRVQQALDSVRPYLGSHAGDVTLEAIDADAGVVHLRLQGSCDGCPSSSLTVKNAIEEAILAAAPDVVAVETAGMVEDSGPALLQIAPFEPHDATGHDGWEQLELDVPPRTLRPADVAGESLVVANLDGTLVAYVDRCPACTAPLSAGRLVGDVLTCHCETAYDARLAGRALAEGGVPLTPLPLLPDHGAWKVALPRRVSA